MVQPILLLNSLQFICNCNAGYGNYACEHSLILSMLWNQKLNFQDVDRAVQLKAKEVKKASTPFNAVAKRKKKQNEEGQQ